MTKNYKQYTEVSYSGRQLLQKYSRDTEGLWRIRGEDPNCDMGGHHHEPELGIFRGRLDDIIRYAVELPSFWTWGGGGRIELMEEPKVIDINTLGIRDELLARQRDLKKELAEVEKRLKEY